MKKKVISLLLCVAMVSAMFVGCGQKEEQTSETTVETKEEVAEAAPEDVTLTVWVPDDIRIESYQDNSMTQWLEEQSGYKLEMVPLASDGYFEKVNVALTTGAIEELPDIIMYNKHNTDSFVYSWALAESILPLTEYYADAEKAVHINKAIERTGVDYTKHIVSPDGNIYSVANYNQSYGNEVPAKFWIYKPWLEKLGAEVPTTTDELYDLLTKVSTTDLNGNGKADEIGMLGSIEGDRHYEVFWKALMNAFVYAGDEQYRVVEDGKVSAAYTTDEWKNGLKYLKGLFDNGSIPVESLSISQDQLITMLNGEEVTVFSFVTFNPDHIDPESGRRMEYTCIETLTGPDGVNYMKYAASAAHPAMVVTANCKNPEAAFTIGDLMSSEYIGISQRWGKEGVDWDYASNLKDTSELTPSVAGFDLSILTYDDSNFWGGTATTKNCWRQVGPYVRQYGLANGWSTGAGGGDEYATMLNEANVLYQNSGHAPAETIPKLIYTVEEAEQITSIEETLKAYVEESMANFVTGKKDIDAEWDSYLAELEKIGLSEYFEVVQEVYTRMYK